VGRADAELIARLRSRDPAAIDELRALLGHAADREAFRRARLLGLTDHATITGIAADARDDAVVAVLGALDRFEGRSRFTTWAWKFAVNIAGVAVRNRVWRDREIPTRDETLETLARARGSVEARAEDAELVEAVMDAIATLTPHRRRVVESLAIAGVPIDVLAARMGTTRGALYKTLHDARRALRERLAQAGFTLDGEDGR